MVHLVLGRSCGAQSSSQPVHRLLIYTWSTHLPPSIEQILVSYNTQCMRSHTLVMPFEGVTIHRYGVEKPSIVHMSQLKLHMLIRNAKKEVEIDTIETRITCESVPNRISDRIRDIRSRWRKMYIGEESATAVDRGIS